MLDLRRLGGALVVALAALLPAACGSDGGSSGGGGGGGSMIGADATLIDEIADGDPVSGNVRVTWRNLNADFNDVTISLVNATSEYGQRLRSGRSTSTVTRVASDAQMGQLLATFQDLGFFNHATDMRLGELPSPDGRRGVVVVERDGSSLGIMLVRKQGLAGSPIPKVYTECKRLIIGLHSQLEGLEVRTNEGEDVFRAPPIRME